MGQKDHQIILGKGTDETLKLSVKTLHRHFACFGSSGRGKTVSSPVNAGTHVSNIGYLHLDFRLLAGIIILGYVE